MMVTTVAPEEQFFRGPVFLFLGLGLLAMYLGVMPTGIIGVACVLLPMAFILEPLGERIPILKDYLGGSPLLLIFSGAALVHFKVLSPAAVESYTNFMQESGSNFLDFFICSLITGAIFGIHSKTLISAGLRYAVPVLGGVLVSCSLLALVGLVTGTGWAEPVLTIGFPILGGGMGSGAVPMSKVINEISGQDMKQLLSIFVPAVVLGNVFSIIAAALLDRLGHRFPALSGNGQLMTGSTLEQEEPRIDFSPANLVIGTLVSCGLYALGKVLCYFIPSLHYLVWMVLAVSICNISGKMPAYIISACFSWYKFAVKAFVGIVLLSIRVVFTDLPEVINAITPYYVLLCASVVIAAGLGAGLAGRMVGFYFIESAITAGLCMTNMGGTGDVAVLSAAK